MLIIFFLITAFFSNDVLVLKNGKIIRCEAFERKGQQVQITSKGKTFSLPVSMIDWPRTQTAQDALDKHLQTKQQQQTEAQVKARAAAEAEETARKERIAELMERGIEQGERPAIVHQTVDLERVGNSLIVAVKLNDQGPFYFILDTGASKTVIAPSLIAEIGVKPTDETISMIGVAGKVIEGKIAKLDSISIGKARVHQFPVSVFAITSLNQANIAGLLGQDFLNHFTAEVNGKQNTLRLIGQQIGTPVAPGSHAGSEQAFDAKNFNADLNSTTISLSQFYRKLFGGESLRVAEWQEMRQTASIITTLEGRLNSFLAASNNSKVPKSDAVRQLQVTECKTKLIPVIRSMQALVRAMQGLQGKDPATYQDLLDKPGAVWEAKNIAYLKCIGAIE